MTIKKRQIALFLALGICTTLASCSTTKTSSETTSVETEVEETKEISVFDGLPEKDFGGQEFNFLVRSDQAYQFDSQEENGDIINDKVYERNRMVEEKYNMKINTIQTPGTWDDKDAFLKMLTGSIMAGDGAFDLVDGYAAYIGNIVLSGLLNNLTEVPHLRLTSAWWSQNAVNDLTVNGKLYCVPGDLSLNLWKNSMVMFFNKQHIKDYTLESPYELVKSGKWTIDKLTEMVKGLQQDINGDGQYTTDDSYGLTFYDDLQYNNFHAAFNVPVTVRDDTGRPILNLSSPEVQNMVDIIKNLVYNTTGVFHLAVAVEQDSAIRAMFEENRVTFMPNLLGTAENLRTMDTDFGIIPFPKLDESQKDYKTQSRDGRTMFCIPMDVKEVDFVGLITEALCVASNRVVIPAYYDTVLKNKITRDNESAEMLDIIRNGLTFDFITEYSIQMASAGFAVRFAIGGNSNFASDLAKNEKGYVAAIDKFLKVYYD